MIPFCIYSCFQDIITFLKEKLNAANFDEANRCISNTFIVVVQVNYYLSLFSKNI